MMSFGSLQVSQNTEVDARVNSDSTLDSTGFLDIDDLIVIHSRQNTPKISITNTYSAFFKSASSTAKANGKTGLSESSCDRETGEREG
jgi:hypothetical protein